MLRYRGPKVLANVKKLDAFPKIPDTYVEKSARGGAISISTFVLISCLVISEIIYFLSTRFDYDYKVDTDFDSKVWLNFDLTIATPCQLIGADVLDVTGQASVYGSNEVKEEATHFELSESEERLRQNLIRLKDHMLNYEDGKKLSEFSLKQNFQGNKLFTKRDVNLKGIKPTSCRIYGHIPLNKLAGNFHIVAGKPIAMFGGHAHLSLMFTDAVYNFTHRIDHLSFGDMRTGFVNALDGDEKITSEQNSLYQYYLDIVATKVDTRRLKTSTYQFSVSEQSRFLNHNTGSHGMPGIYFKYDFSPLAVLITERRVPFGHFLVRLCGIIGGIFATSCIVNGLLSCLPIYAKSENTQRTKKQSEASFSKSTLNNGLHVDLQNTVTPQDTQFENIPLLEN